LSEIHRAGPDAVADHDQASGLRRIFEPARPSWTLVVLPAQRSAGAADAIAARARLMAVHAGATLVIDAARVQVAAALGLRLRYDLAHAMAGDCEFGEACAGAGGSLWVLPAARALDSAMTDELQAARVASAVQSLAGGMRRAILVVPAVRASWLCRCPDLAEVREAWMPVAGGADAATAVLTAVRQAAGDAQIDTFHLLFPGMGEAAAGRLSTALAAIAKRHFGVTLRPARPVVTEPPLTGAVAPAGTRSVESLF
jgi:hypothetical protein